MGQHSHAADGTAKEGTAWRYEGNQPARITLDPEDRVTISFDTSATEGQPSGSQAFTLTDHLHQRLSPESGAAAAATEEDYDLRCLVTPHLASRQAKEVPSVILFREDRGWTRAGDRHDDSHFIIKLDARGPLVPAKDGKHQQTVAVGPAPAAAAPAKE